MYFVAVIGWLIGLIPFVNMVSDPLTAFALYIIASPEERDALFNKGVGKTIVAAVIEFVPIIDIIPAWPIRVYMAKHAVKLAEQDG
jgi:divalent metal cation (Fe/Co/Zn/Cd) transporter